MTTARNGPAAEPSRCLWRAEASRRFASTEEGIARLGYFVPHMVCLFIAFLLLPLLLLGCSSSGEQGGEAYKSIFELNPCATPCWHGIVPGETKSAGFMELLKKNQFVDQSTVRTGMEGRGTVTDWRLRGSYSTQATAYLSATSVVAIDWYSGVDLKLGTVIERFGDPPSVQTWSGLFGQEQAGYAVGLFYPEKGIMFYTKMEPLPATNRAIVRSDLLVEQILLFPKGSVEQFQSAARPFTALKSIALTPIQDWRGLGEYPILRGAAW